MPRSALAYLADIVDACRLIEGFLLGVDIPRLRSECEALLERAD